MKALVAKEIRLLLPACAGALLLAIVPVWLMSKGYNPQQPVAALYPVCLATLLLAMSTFGREFGLKTFALMLTQPIERRRIWRVKIVALTAALATVVVIWSFCCIAWLHDWNGNPTWRSVVPLGAAVSFAIFAGGLWTTLLLRQVAAAFWLTALIPAGIAMLIAPDSRLAPLFYVVLGLYSLGGIILAWWQFFHAEEVGWTGGTVALAGLRSAGNARASEQSLVRQRRPLAALLRKELQLNRGGLMGMGAFFVLHLGAVMLRSESPPTETSAVQEVLEFIGGLWLLVPLFLVGPGVAEERRLGTLDVQLCQPVSSRLQFVIKLLFSLLAGGLLSAFLLWTAEGIGSARGVPSGLGEIPLFIGLKTPFDPASLLNLVEIFLALSLAGFLASTLARGTIQAMAAAPAVLIVMVLLDASVSGAWRIRLTGTLLPYVLWPSIVAALVWCAWRNFRFVAMGWRFWGRNIIAFAGAAVFGIALAGAVHNRLWEFLTPLETAHGPARLPVAGVLDLKPRGIYDSPFTLVLPDGRAWVNEIMYQLDFARGQVRWIGGLGNRFINGSNWVDVLGTGRDVVGIRADGTLWVSESSDNERNWRNEPARLVQYGADTNWKSITYGQSFSVFLLKQDGTLWQWKSSPSAPDRRPKSWPGLRAFVPRQLGTDSDWSRVFGDSGRLFTWKNDGTAWMFYGFDTKVPLRAVAIASNLAAERVPALDHFDLRSLARIGVTMAGVRDDGSLWTWDWVTQQRAFYSPLTSYAAPQQVGTETDWRMLATQTGTLTALKADGSLWQFPLKPDPAAPRDWPQFNLEKPVQLGSHRDWVAIDTAYGPYAEGLRALAADGSLWYWENRTESPYYYGPALLAPSRKPMLIGNIFTDFQ